MKISHVPRLLLFCFCGVLAAASCSKKGSDQPETMEGIKGSTIYYHNHGEGQKAGIGDLISFHFRMMKGDTSELVSTYSQGSPTTLKIPDTTGPKIMQGYNQDPAMPALRKAHVGDSFSVAVLADSLYQGGRGMPKFIAKGDSLTIVVKVTDVLKPKKAKAQEKESIEKYVSASEKEFKTAESGLRYSVEQPDLGSTPENGDSVIVNYTLTSIEGDTIDQSPPGRDFGFILGEGQVIPGWEEGLGYVPAGSQATFVVPSKLAYGEKGSGPIDPYSPLVFNVKVKEVVESASDGVPGANSDLSKSQRIGDSKNSK